MNEISLKRKLFPGIYNLKLLKDVLIGFDVSHTLYHSEGKVPIVRVEVIKGAYFYICLNYLDIDWDIPELLVSSIHLHCVSIL